VLRLLLDAHISPVVANQLKRRATIVVETLVAWQEGAHLSSPDDTLLLAAFKSQLTLVTYDTRTIVPLLKNWGEQGIAHGGVVFVDHLTVAPNDYGGLVLSLFQLWTSERKSDWTNRIVYLTRQS
jgi:hypothetical protein